MSLNGDIQVQQVLQALKEDAADDTMPPDQFKTKGGIVLRLKRVSPFLVKDARERLVEPKPPMVYMEDKETTEENLADPEYQQALQEFQITLSEVGNSILLSMGTSVETVPPGTDPPESDDWVEAVEEMVGIPVPKTPRRRYYLWMKYVAITDLDDFINLLGKITRLSGMVTEAAVAQATAEFSGVPQGNTPDRVPPPPKIERRDSNSSADTGLRA